MRLFPVQCLVLEAIYVEIKHRHQNTKAMDIILIPACTLQNVDHLIPKPLMTHVKALSASYSASRLNTLSLIVMEEPESAMSALWLVWNLLLLPISSIIAALCCHDILNCSAEVFYMIWDPGCRGFLPFSHVSICEVHLWFQFFSEELCYEFQMQTSQVHPHQTQACISVWSWLCALSCWNRKAVSPNCWEKLFLNKSNSSKPIVYIVGV